MNTSDSSPHDSGPVSSLERMRRIDTQLSHLWMVRTFLKHSEEAEEDDELREVHRALYDYMLALGGPLAEQDATAYLKTAAKKYARLRRAADLFFEIQPEISGHTNFQMAARSLAAVLEEIKRLIDAP